MKKNIFLVIVASLMTLTSCQPELIFPHSSGRPYEVLVVLENEIWNAPSGRALFDVLDTDVPGLPQSERSFRISHTEPEHFSQAMKIFRNIIQVNINPKMFSKTRMRFMRDKFARDQIVLTINTPSEESLQDFCLTHRLQIVDFITRTEMNRQIKEFELKHSSVTEQLAWNIFGCKLYAPKEITSYKQGKNFFWSSNNSNSGIINICMYNYYYEGPETFNKQYVLAKRDSVMKANIPGEKEGMYMTTDTMYTQVKAINVHGKYAMEARGLWYMENDAMGGPFVSHSRIDTETNQVIVVEGFVYAPEKKKRDLMRRLEASLYTLLLPTEQFELALKTNVKEENANDSIRESK